MHIFLMRRILQDSIGDVELKPVYHLDSKIVVLNSIRRPKLLIIRGNDEKEHKFLVKGGEDQRQDQRIETLFELINDLLRSDSHCYQRNLSIRTYQVIPMTTKIALIEWLNNTRTLKDIIYNSLSESESKYLQQANKNPIQAYQRYIDDTSADDSSKLTRFDSYGRLYTKYKRSFVCKRFNEIQNLLPWDLLRRYIRSMSTSTDGFFFLRNQFIVSYAVASICQYVLGIGDRHLSNWMVDTKTGHAIGIDFGMAFGHATLQLPIPEVCCCYSYQPFGFFA
jgi:DNA-dependent protein kinase catalytic subunit